MKKNQVHNKRKNFRNSKNEQKTRNFAHQHTTGKQQYNHTMQYDKKSSQIGGKKEKKEVNKFDSKNTYSSQPRNKENTIVLAGVKTGLRMTKLNAIQRTHGVLHQKDNPIPTARSRNYPKEAIPRVLPPDTSLKLVSSSSGNSISEVLTAFNKGSSEDCMSFDEAMAYVQAYETLQEGQEIRYIGSGKFAVIEFEHQDKKKNMKIIRTIDFETIKDKREWREKLQYRISFIEITTVTPLSELYTQSELDSFREFNNS